ncbi:nickel pincer cofactor biosynthesis protein LarC [Puniceicoccales bacterium CK1056]|uniref:Pyridinium-3,5-bisthiocarboxylic acid mononucleotide nickel insertion protein n=1 Tax=Oceanipulchritudo coccoides TaxID=2706888 RepID=A0A6B2M5U3_9BACT|nr:nickel pincer cofactor biosynthesis protein LarC [Oceanipulchritudo coccoides]NDV63474.1 nickel pincer cofactor biosynthesis protein LarC [Oceanipulchritudo coccoides]
MKVLHYNCPAGICGDMHLGAMIDLGVDPKALVDELNKLGLEGWEINFHKDQRKGISGTRCDVNYKDEHHHRTFADIRDIIESSSLDSAVKDDAIQVFRVLAEAEGAVHGKPADKIHFHEVGAVDSILDIVGAAVCWNLLGVEKISASTIELGSGTVQCAHGKMPVPAPATAKLVAEFPVSLGGTAKEATTPTGAALLAGKGCVFGEALNGRSVANGIGIGQRDDPSVANVLYVTMLETDTDSDSGNEQIIELATNLDDMTPEHIAFLAELIMEAGALDVWQTPATFKKGRMGCVLTVLADPGKRKELTALIFKHSTTLGIRWREWNRNSLNRESREVKTPLGTVSEKIATLKGGTTRSKVEFDDLAKLARENNLSLAEIETLIRNQDVDS